MAIKKSELYSSLWKSCDELRGGMDASQYKDYILVLLFVKYVSDRYAGNPNSLIDVPAGGSFADMVELKGDKEIGDKLNIIIGKLAEANDLKGVIDVADFNNPDMLGKGKEMVDRLSNLVSIFDSPALNFKGNSAQGDDILGDAYEYLMRHFATESGKSKGQFYTPAEVSRVMAQVLELNQANSSSQTIYDPTCGSASLLLKAHDEAKNHTGFDLALYGQEMDNATSALAKMNMILHDCPTAEIWKDNTVAAPHFKEADGSLKRHDFVVANPPFSTKAWSNGIDPLNDPYGRFEYGIPPEKNGDYAFLLHILASLKSSGKGAVILPHGVLFRGGAEAAIRQKLLSQGYIKGIIGLPANLFYGTGIPACIIVLDKENAHARKGIFMIDASKGFIKDGNKNRLREQDIHLIVDTFNAQRERPRYSKLVSLGEIAANDYNLNLPRYIDSSEAEDLQDLAGHLRGGIPNADIDALQNYWDVIPAVRAQLFKDSPYEGYCDLAVPVAEIKPTIYQHAEFVAFQNSVSAAFDLWVSQNCSYLDSIDFDTQPRQLIKLIAEDILSCFKSVALVDQYDVYQHLMDYWDATMKDDVYLLVAEGWDVANQVRRLLPVKDKNGKDKYQEEADFVVDKVRYKAEIIPPALIINRYFSKEQVALDTLERAMQVLEQELEAMQEEHGGEDGLLAEVIEDGKISKANITARLREVLLGEEAAALRDYQQLLDKHAKANKRYKDAKRDLDIAVINHYPTLNFEEIQILVIDDKWLTTLATDVHTEQDRVSQALTSRVKQLAERYATPLPKLADKVQTLALTVEQHLKKMGLQWS